MDTTSRLKYVLALELTRIVEDLEFRRDLLIDVWGKHRDRGPLIDTVFSRWETIAVGELTDLDENTNLLLDSFYRELAELKLLFTYTEVMPTQLGDLYDRCVVRMRAAADPALAALDVEIIRPELPAFDESVWDVEKEQG
jgi:hypothetical protein